MNYYGAKELAAAFRSVRENTIQIAEDVPETHYDFKAAPDTRSVAQTLVHIGLATTFPHHVHSNSIADMSDVKFPELFAQVGAREATLRSKPEIVAFLKSEGEKFATFLETLSELFLAERVTLLPGWGPSSKTRFELLWFAKEHEIHHRAQLMVMERMLGIVPHLTRQLQERLARLPEVSQPVT